MPLRSWLVPVLAVSVVTAMSALTTQFDPTGPAVTRAAAHPASTPGATDVASAYVAAAAPTTNFGTSTTLEETSNVATSYLTFDVSGLTGAPSSATLRLYSESKGVTPTTVSASPGGWTQSGLTWDNRPTVGGVIARTGALASGQWIEADVTAAVSGNGLVSFALTSTATANRYDSSNNGADPPQLVVSGGTTTGGAHVTKVLTVIEENHSLAQMQADMPYLDSLATEYSYASDYTAISHPSLPNYLAISSGSTHGVTADGSPSTYPIAGTDIFDEALAAGRTAKAYAETMTTNCQQGSAGLYAARHNPWVYYDGATERADCAQDDAPAGTPTSGALASAVKAGTLPDAGMFTPNLCNDAHNGGACTLGVADAYLKTWLPSILAGPDFTSGDLAVVVTADENDGSSGNKVLTVVLSKSLAGTHSVVSTPLSHYSLSGLYSDITGTAALNNAATAPDMKAAFHLP